MTGKIDFLSTDRKVDTKGKKSVEYIKKIVENVFTYLDNNYNFISNYINYIPINELDWLIGYCYKEYEMLKREKYSKKMILLYLVTKITSIISLWTGYISEGGKFPILDSHNYKNIDSLFLSLVSTTNEKNCNNLDNLKCTVVIPTMLNYDYKDLLNIKKYLITPLSKLDYINKIIFIGNFKKDSYEIFDNIKNLEFIKIDKNPPAYARNVGIKESTYLNSDVTLFIDDDVVINDINNLKALIYKSYLYNSISSPLIKSFNSSWLDMYHDFDGTLNGVYFKNNNCLLYSTTCCMAVCNKLFYDGIKFDTNYRTAAGEDIDFSLEAIKKGYRIIPVDSIHIYHNYKYTLDTGLEMFIKRFFRYGIGNYQLKNTKPYYFYLLDKYCKVRRTIKKLKKTDSYQKEILKLVKYLEL
ncbi:glycosyltransferase family 2 protein [Methanocaldococcus infernus]